MRNYSEYTAKNLLRQPLIFGMPLFGLMALIFSVLLILVFFGNSRVTNVMALAFAGLGYLGLRFMSRFASVGWEELGVFWIERSLKRKDGSKNVAKTFKHLELNPANLLTHEEQIYEKEKLTDSIRALKPGQDLLIRLKLSQAGWSVDEEESLSSSSEHIYSLIGLPVATNPLWADTYLKGLDQGARVYVRVQGVDPQGVKRQIEYSRKRNLNINSQLKDIDSDVTFQEASQVLESLSRGDETLVKCALVITSPRALSSLDTRYFKLEKQTELALQSVVGKRSRFFRKFTVRVVTATDLIPTFVDPKESGKPVFKSPQRLPIYFSPLDLRLEALHWLVVGASGSGKSFLTGLVLKRLIQQGEKISVLFLDHGRSFRRVIRSVNGKYLEPEVLSELEAGWSNLSKEISQIGTLSGIELSELNLSEKKEAAHFVLSQIDHLLRSRTTFHPVYLVLDECWNFLRDEPVLVQKAFREFRKFNAGVIAITQSLSDFVTDQTGQSIFQNAPIRILLRQGEDLTPFRGALGLNDVELARVRLLRQRRGEYSECIIKTPFLSRLARLHPDETEYESLRTDNLREELIREQSICG